MDEDTITTPRAAGQRLIIKRPRLTKLLDESEARTVVLLAPGGYGKTTLLREWLGNRSDVAWYSGGPAMADVAALATDVAASLTVRAGADEAVERVRALASHGQGAEPLALAVASLVPADVKTLVIDDYHFGADSPDTHAFMMVLLGRSPLRLVLASRTRPGWVTSRMVVYGDVTILGASVLAFTDVEAHDVLGTRDGEREGVLAHAQGWPAVIGLAAIRAAASDPGAALPRAELYDYFAEDMYKTSSPELRTDVLLLALGADSAPEVARQIFGSRHDKVIAEASARGFITRDRGAKIAMHPLLRDFLTAKLHELAANESAEHLGCVISALTRERRWDECLVALQGFPNTDLIVDTLRDAFFSLLDSGRLATIEQWVELARHHRIGDPVLFLADAELALRRGDRAQAQALGERAGKLLEGDLAARAYLVATRAAHLRDDSDAVATNARGVEATASTVALRVDALWLLIAHASERGDDSATKALERLRELDDERPDYALRVHMARSYISLFCAGEVRSAARELELGAGLLAHITDPLLRTSHVSNQAQVRCMQAEYRSALDLISQLFVEAESNGLDFAFDYAFVTQAAALGGARQLWECQRTVEALTARPSMAYPHIAANAAIQTARLRIASGDLDRAAILLTPDPAEPVAEVIRNEYLAYRGLVLAARGDLGDARRALAEVSPRRGFVEAITIAELGAAIVALQTGDGHEALASTAIQHNYAIGQLDSIVVACRAFPELATAGAHDPRTAKVLTEVFGRSNDVDIGRQAGLVMPRELRSGDVLSPRERDVYDLLIQGLTNAEIGRRLFISESTAKVHVRHIYEKLGVHTRAEAARARMP